MILSGSVDKTLKLWKVSDGSLIRTLEGHASWVLLLYKTILLISCRLIAAAFHLVPVKRFYLVQLITL